MSSLRPGVVNFEVKWADLSQTITAAVRLRPVKRLTWNNNISDIYALCTALPKSFAESLYEHTKSLLESNVSTMCEEILSLDSRSLLCRYHLYWMSYRQGAHYLNGLFSYFNRVHLNKYRPQDSLDYNIPGIVLPPSSPVDPNVPVEIRNMTLRVWCEQMINVLSDRLINSILAEIARDREGDESDLRMVHDVIQSLIEVAEYENKEQQFEYYEKVFEEPFLVETGTVYRQEASQLVSDLSYSEYLREAVRLLQNAKIRGEKFLHQSSIIKFIRECETRLVTDQIDYLLSFVPLMIQTEQLSDLSNLFLLLGRVPKTLEPVVNEFREKVKNEGLCCMKTLHSSKQSPEVLEFMNVVLNVYRKYKGIVHTVFGGHKSFLSALDEGCKGFVNYSEGHQQCQSPRLLSRYCDQLLKKGTKGISDSELEEKLDDSITVFHFIEDKDTFQKFYSRMLSRRLVYGNFVSMEAEENMIQKLKHVCGYEYTARLQRMLLDITLSHNLVIEFNELLHKDTKDINFTTLILQSGAWQLTQSPCPSIILPPKLLTISTKFEAFYGKKHCGRHLSWLHHHATGELKLYYLKKPYLVTMTVFQMIVILLFEETDRMALKSIQDQCQMELRELKTTVQSLVDAKLLLKEMSTSVTDDDNSQFSLNIHYSNKRTKFKVSGQLQKETHQDIEQTHHMILEDRKMFIQAALVRVMKHRKTLTHNHLIGEVIVLVKNRFNPNIPLIKKCIEALIDKQYIERSSESKDTYHYIA